MKSYKVYYVGDDSLGHRMVVRAENHNEAIQKVKKATGADVVTGIRRCMNPYVKAGIVVVSTLAVFSLLIVSCVRTA